MTLTCPASVGVAAGPPTPEQRLHAVHALLMATAARLTRAAEVDGLPVLSRHALDQRPGLGARTAVLEQLIPQVKRPLNPVGQRLLDRTLDQTEAVLADLTERAGTPWSVQARLTERAVWQLCRNLIDRGLITGTPEPTLHTLINTRSMSRTRLEQAARAFARHRQAAYHLTTTRVPDSLRPIPFVEPPATHQARTRSRTAQALARLDLHRAELDFRNEMNASRAEQNGSGTDRPLGPDLHLIVGRRDLGADLIRRLSTPMGPEPGKQTSERASLHACPFLLPVHRTLQRARHPEVPNLNETTG